MARLATIDGSTTASGTALEARARSAAPGKVTAAHAVHEPIGTGETTSLRRARREAPRQPSCWERTRRS